MTCSRTVEVSPGIAWEVMSDDGLFNGPVVCVPIKNIIAMTNEQLGTLARAAVMPARAAYASNLAHNIVHEARFTKAAKLLDLVTQDDIELIGDCMGFDPVIAKAYFLLVEAAQAIEAIERRKDRIKKLRSDVASSYGRLFVDVGRRDGFLCSLCGYTGTDLQIDHIVPVSKGGGNELENLQLLCKTCNIAKSNRS